MTHSIYTADIHDADLDSMVTVDIRTLESDRLAALLDEASAAGDRDLVDAIESVLCPSELAKDVVWDGGHAILTSPTGTVYGPDDIRAARY